MVWLREFVAIWADGVCECRVGAWEAWTEGVLTAVGGGLYSRR